VQLTRIEIAPERFPARRDPLSQLAMEVARRLFLDCVRRVGVVEHDFGAARPARQLTERREHRLLGQIGRDAEPNDKGPFVRVQPGGLKRLDHAPVFEIVGDIGDIGRFGDLRLYEPASLLGLRRRMIELEDPQIGGALESIGEGVETCAEHQDLPHAFFDRMCR
jgi:hypothetical protein